ncbi:MAG: helix-turn-helix domain-containing protein [Oleispira sp.]|nr:helix-turn-helix domain-containing protein [Oleispira sp.]MBL4879909.1 helix-turn-helix domain-containing protein [Oleispira sp.]
MKLQIINYPGAMQTATLGLYEMFLLANRFAEEHALEARFDVEIIEVTELATAKRKNHIVILPPNIVDEYFLSPEAVLNQWIVKQHKQGAVICAVCAGTFILAETGLLNNRPATTHWGLSDQLQTLFTEVKVNSEKIIINDGDLITAGGLMSWMDLGLELVAQFLTPAVMRQLGKFLIIDTAPREQRYYQSFNPRFDHGDDVIHKIQTHMQAKFHTRLTVASLAKKSHLSERTFARHFIQATGFKANEYLQRLRIQKACELLESTKKTFEVIAYDVGYEDVSACRKSFVKIIGLTPKEFRRRFV